MEETQETITKKGRHRKKQLYRSILEMMEFYFSDSNLNKDRFLSKLIEVDPYVDLSIFMKFNKIRRLTDNTKDIAKSIANSSFLQLSEDKTKVCRTTKICEKADQDECTIYVERLPVDAEHDWLKDLFTKFGKVDYVSIPKYKLNKMIKGFAFIEFSTPAEAQEALKYFELIGCKLPTQMPPEDLASVVTFETEKNEPENNKEQEVKTEDTVKEESEESEKKSKKRKLSTSEDDAAKRPKNEEGPEVAGSKNDEQEEEDKDDENGKKKRKRKKNHKKNSDPLKQLGLKVLSKREWKQLRNKYLNLQRVKMKHLKDHLHQTRNIAHAADSSAGADQRPSEAEAESAPRLKFVPSTIVCFRVPENCTDLKKLKKDVKAHAGVEYVDVGAGDDVGYARFAGADAAREFSESQFSGEMRVLGGDEERVYWDKILQDRKDKLHKDTRKQRGRDKLLKKAERELGKHIRFDHVD